MKKMKVFQTEDGTIHATVAAAQHHDLTEILKTFPSVITGDSFCCDYARLIIENAVAIRACLPKPARKTRTPKTSKIPKAKKTASLDTGRGTFSTHEKAVVS